MNPLRLLIFQAGDKEKKCRLYTIASTKDACDITLCKFWGLVHTIGTMKTMKCTFNSVWVLMFFYLIPMISSIRGSKRV